MNIRPNLRKYVGTALVILTLCAGLVQAQSIRPVPDPGGVRSSDASVEYVGRFGEVFKLSGDWQIVPSVHGNVEVIDYFPMFRPDGPPDSIERFKPKPSDFAPEKFSRLSLVQLDIISKGPDALRSLEELKSSKIKDLRASGVAFQVIEDPFFGPVWGHWPKGTFEIYVSSPYRLTQLYTATSSQLCVLTSGFDAPPSTEILRHSTHLRYELASWIVPQDRTARDDESTPREIWAKGISLHPFAVPAVWIGWLAVTGFAFLLAGLFGAKKKDGLLRRTAFSVLVFSNAGALIGGLSGLLLWSFPRMTRHAPVAAALACLAMPFVAGLVGRIRGSAASRRALIGVSLYALVSLTFLAYCGMFDWGPGSKYFPSLSAIISFLSYGLAGVVFGALESDLGSFGGAGLQSALLILLLVTPRAWSQSSTDAALDARARRELAASGVTEERLKIKAGGELAKTRGVYKFQRVEIKGIFSPGEEGSDNDSNGYVPDLFDEQIAPSHVGETDARMPDWMKAAGRTYSRLKDLDDLHKDAVNQLSSTAENVVKRLEGEEVNEIVAHSWGTEIVYNAILANKILPPKRLIVCGMPDKDLEKWKALSKYTGTEVIVYTNSLDPAAGTARFVGGARTGLLDENVWENIRGDAREFDLQWAAACQAPRKCNPHDRTPGKVVFRDDYKYPSHDRIRYYQAMADAGDLPPTTDGPSLRPFAASPPKSAVEMKADQDQTIASLAHQLYEGKVRHKREALEAAAAADAGGDSFFDDAAKGKGISDAVVAMNDENAALKEDIRKTAERRDQLIHDMKVRREYNVYSYILSALGLACSDPKEFHGQIDHGNSLAVEIDSNLLSTYFAEDMSRDGAKSWGPRPNSCQVLLMQRLISSQDQVTTAMVLQWAAEYRRAHPSQLQKFTASVGDFLGSFGSLFSGGDGGSDSIERAEPRDRSSSRSSSGDGGEQFRRSMDAQNRSLAQYDPVVHKVFYGDGPHSPDNWNSLNQLRGMAK